MRLPKNFHPVGVSKNGMFLACHAARRAPRSAAALSRRAQPPRSAAALNQNPSRSHAKQDVEEGAFCV